MLPSDSAWRTRMILAGSTRKSFGVAPLHSSQTCQATLAPIRVPRHASWLLDHQQCCHADDTGANPHRPRPAACGHREHAANSSWYHAVLQACQRAGSALTAYARYLGPSVVMPGRTYLYPPCMPRHLSCMCSSLSTFCMPMTRLSQANGSSGCTTHTASPCSSPPAQTSNLPHTLLPPASTCCKAVPARPRAAAAQRQRRQGIAKQSSAWAPAEDKSSPHCTATYQTLREQRAHNWVEWKRASYMPSCRRLAMLS